MTPTKKLKILLFILLISLLVATSSHAIQTVMNQSKAFQILSKQAEQTYLKPFGEQMERIYKKDIVNAAMLLGLAMQGQKAYVEKNPQYLPQLKELIRETLSFLQVLAQNNNNRNPRDGRYIDNNSLSEQFYNAMMGNMNNWVTQNYHKNPAKVRNSFILNQVGMASHGGSPGNQTHGTFIEKEDTAAISLFGNEAPPAESPKNTQLSSDHSAPTGQCSKQASRKSLYIDAGTNKTVKYPTKFCVGCFYENGMLERQTPYVNNKQHGTEERYKVSNGQHYMYSSTPFTNGMKDGISEHYKYDVKSGRLFKRMTLPYKEGKIDGMMREYLIHKGTYYLYRTTPYLNGEIHGVIESYQWTHNDKKYLTHRTVYNNGKRREYTRYKANGAVDYRKTY